MNNRDKQEEFLLLFEPMRERLSRYALAIARDHEEARDLASETILKAYESFDRLVSKEAFPSYLFTIATRIYRRRRWRLRLFVGYDESWAETIPSTDAKPDDKADITILYEALQTLPKKQREAIILFEISGFSIEEITKIQGGTLSGVKSRLRRAREKLTELIGEREQRAANKQKMFPKIKSKQALEIT